MHKHMHEHMLSIEYRLVQTGRSGFVFIANGGNHDIKMYDVSEEEDMHTFRGHQDSVTDIHIIHGPFAMQLLTVRDMY